MNKNFIFRLTDDILKRITKVVNNNPETYMNKSHFIRVAIIKELRRNKQ